MNAIKILWVDDEIELLKPHLLFLEKKNYDVSTCNNGAEAIERVDDGNFDVVFLDENMPGLSGIETLSKIKAKLPNLPIVMITKSEEEYIMEEAIGSKIADYLIKPVNPNQILLSLKKNLDHSRLVSEKTTSTYQQEFRKISLDLAMVNTFEEWIDLYKKLVHWEIELESIDDPGMMEILESQKEEANSQFFKFIQKNYQGWFEGEEKPLLSQDLFKQIIAPQVKKEKTLLIVIDNLRFDQLRVLEPIINNYYKKEEEISFFSILPTATQYARNAIFSGLTPLEMSKQHPDYWKNDTDEGGKNLYEKEFLEAQLKRLNLDIKHDYFKITSLPKGRDLAANFKSVKDNDLTVIVYNFVDMLSHSRTEMEMIKELASDDKAYRSLTLSWFKNSPLLEIIQKAQEYGLKLIITTDHGTINTKKPTKIVGEKSISANLRYKTGRSLTYTDKEVFAVKNPEDIQLPSIHMSSSFVFAKEDYFFAYPNNYNHYVKYYKNTYQHGGVSLEEMIIPCIIMEPK
ncbi:bifunctional response regulator/alkaline phosphatase family protein [Aureibaculum sp. 2210JD6-5]|uniref:T9SS response regulator signal transducer PorX n=1 Tax=Aureibaculum sp. 2210JD6-5 TaxID=3103957 RepID=UPI002AAD3538|nr:bifunctional response regulator/alkaline phosphatase family protein [Aureibaculum sp. 2210JD6-5]MDY7396356.1 bifunctional response regulator/alkaline phosphatase family protein [Aureibaculum sp. 2210JD6-5]